MKNDIFTMKAAWLTSIPYLNIPWNTFGWKRSLDLIYVFDPPLILDHCEVNDFVKMKRKIVIVWSFCLAFESSALLWTYHLST